MNTYALSHRIFNSYYNTQFNQHLTNLLFTPTPVHVETEFDDLCISQSDNAISVLLTDGIPYCAVDFYLKNMRSDFALIACHFRVYVNKTTFDQLANYDTDTHSAFFRFEVNEIFVASNYNFSRRGELKLNENIPLKKFWLQVHEKEKATIANLNGALPVASKSYVLLWVITFLLSLILLFLWI